MLHYDVVVVGAGITGLSTAASLKEQSPALNILVLERGTLPSGASTKNAGFACFGSISELAQDRKTLGDEGMVELVEKRWKGLQKTISRLGREQIGLEQKGGYELLNTENAHYLHDIPVVNQLLSPLFPEPVFRQADDRLATFGFGKTTHLVYNPYEGQLHTGELIRMLWKYCSQLGVQVITGTEVQHFGQGSGGHIHIQTGSNRFTARAMALCTNAFTRSLVSGEMDLTPGRGMVMLVRPKSPVKISGTYHYEEGYYYFRDFKDRIIFGGGRNLALEEEITTEFGINQKIEARLHQDLREVILPGTDYTVEMQWSGIMAFGQTKAPILRKIENGVYLGVRLGGMGVALGSLIGEELAGMILADRF